MAWDIHKGYSAGIGGCHVLADSRDKLFGQEDSLLTCMSVYMAGCVSHCQSTIVVSRDPCLVGSLA